MRNFIKKNVIVTNGYAREYVNLLSMILFLEMLLFSCSEEGKLLRKVTESSLSRHLWTDGDHSWPNAA